MTDIADCYLPGENTGAVKGDEAGVSFTWSTKLLHLPLL